MSSPIKNTPLFYVYQSFLQFISEKDSFNECARSNQNIKAINKDNSSKFIIVVIGESFNRHHSSLYGYPLKTNPKLQSEKNLFIFDNVISTMNATSTSFKHFLSLSSTDQTRNWYESPLFPAVFKQAGYNVVFYSNQYVKDINTSSTNASVGFFNRSELAPKLFNHRNTMKYQYDGLFLDAYKANREELESDSLNLVILHLIGQHFMYSKRFPAEYKHFTERDYAYRKELNSIQKQEVSDYDNATLYNDSIVDEIIQMYKDKNAMIVYFADHGDEINDYRVHVGRSSGLHEIGAPGLHCQLDVPFIVWLSDKWIEMYPKDKERLEKSLHKPFMLDDLPHFLFDMASIGVDGYDSTRSLVNESFNSLRKRIVSPLGTQPVDYDSVSNCFGTWKVGKFIN